MSSHPEAAPLAVCASLGSNRAEPTRSGGARFSWQEQGRKNVIWGDAPVCGWGSFRCCASQCAPPCFSVELASAAASSKFRTRISCCKQKEYCKWQIAAARTVRHDNTVQALHRSLGRDARVHSGRALPKSVRNKFFYHFVSLQLSWKQ